MFRFLLFSCNPTTYERILNHFLHHHSVLSMIQFNPLMPISLVALYSCLASAILILCTLSTVAVYRTKKTPYGAKLLSIGLLTYDILFLLFSPVSKLFEFNDVFLVWHATRGFQIAAQVVVGCMAIERLFVINWPYVYLRVMNERRFKVVCSAVSILGFLHYSVMRGIFCYARDKAVDCESGFPAYLITLCIVLSAISFISFIRIYKIIRKSEDKHRPMHTIRQYKGTVAAFLVLVNTTVSQVIWLGLSVMYFTRKAGGTAEDGFVATLADWSNLVNCIVDPAIYVIWFRETRMELMKLVKGIFPWVQPKIEKLRIEIYQLDVTDCVKN